MSSASSVAELPGINGQATPPNHGASCREDSALTRAASAEVRDHVRQSVLKLKPYIPGKPIEEVKRELGLAEDFKLFKLASNENVLGPSPKAVEAMRAAAEDVWLYPDDTCYALKHALADFFSLTPEHFVLGNGSDEVIHFLGLAFLDSNRQDEVVFAHPSFVQYKAAAMMADCPYISVPLTEDMTHDLRAMRAAVTERTKLLFIANPNNPTGTTVSKADFDEFLDGLPSRVVVVMDEAYREYVDDPNSPDGLDYIADHNVVVLRTFSKAYAIAGTRCGYGVARPELIRYIQQVRGPFNVNSISQAAALAGLGDQEHIRNSVAMNAAGKAQLYRGCEELGLEYIPTQANFVLMNAGVDSAAIFNDLLRHGVIVRTGTPFGLSNWLRVTVGTSEMNERFIWALREVLKLHS